MEALHTQNKELKATMETDRAAQAAEMAELKALVNKLLDCSV